MIRKSMRSVVVSMCLLAVLGMANAAAAVDAPRWVAALYVEQQKMVGLRWMPVPGATGYKVFRTVTAGKDQQEIAGTTTPQYLDSAAEPGTTYYYSLKSVAGAELSPASDEKTVAIPGAKKSGVETPEMESVTLQTSTEFGKTVYKVGVLWRGKGSGAIAFNLYRSLAAGKQGEMVASSQETRYVDVAVEPGKTYYYTVSALDGAFQETKPSAEKSIEVKAPEAAASTKKPKKEYPKLVPIPAAKGEARKLTSDPYDIILLDDGTIYYTAGHLYVMDGFEGTIKDITPEGIASVYNIGLGLGGEILATVLNTPDALIIDGPKVKTISLPPMATAFKNDAGQTIAIKRPQPIDITQNIDGKYWITDAPNNRVCIFEDNGVSLGNAMAGTPSELIHNPTSISHDSKGNVFAVSGGANYVNIYDKDGMLTGSFGETGNIAGSFGRVGGIFVDQSDNLWITDLMNTTIQKFDNTGKFLGALSAPDGKSGLGLATPGSIAIDKKGQQGFISQGIDKSILPFTLVR